MYNCYNWGFPGGSDSKVSACNAGDVGSIPGSGRSPGEGNGNPLQYSCLKIPWMEEPGGYNPQGCKKSDTTERLHIHITDITGASLVAQLVKNLPVMQETWVQSLGWEDPLEKGMATHSSILA